MLFSTGMYQQFTYSYDCLNNSYNTLQFVYYKDRLKKKKKISSIPPVKNIYSLFIYFGGGELKSVKLTETS